MTQRIKRHDYKKRMITPEIYAELKPLVDKTSSAKKQAFVGWAEISKTTFSRIKNSSDYAEFKAKDPNVKARERKLANQPKLETQKSPEQLTLNIEVVGNHSETVEEVKAEIESVSAHLANLLNKFKRMMIK